ncbi:MAG: hypothetical protein V4724_30905 [Pseudomonadota bacterium]
MKIAAVAILSIPALVAVIHNAGPNAEKRDLAPLPERPANWASALEMPAKLNAWVNDHFGYRKEMVEFNNQLRFKLFREFPSIQMVSGRHGRYFLAAHAIGTLPFQAIGNVCGRMSPPSPGTVEYFNRLFADFHRMGLQPKMLIVPSAPVLYSEDMPAFLVDNCASMETPSNVVLNAPDLSQEARDAIFFPLREMRQIKNRATLFPRSWFHWSGAGLDDVAQLSLSHFWGLSAIPAPPLKTMAHMEPSDVAHLFPGIDLRSEIVEPDLAASGIEGCYGARCFPEFGDFGETLYDISRFKNPKAPARRLVILSDSFGSKITPWYARYYREVEHVATNNMAKLGTQQIKILKDVLFRDPGNIDLMFLYHDGGAVQNTLRFGIERLHEPASLAQAAGKAGKAGNEGSR